MQDGFYAALLILNWLRSSVLERKVNCDFRWSDNVYVHLHEHLEEVKLRVVLELVYIQYFLVVCVVEADP